jgi:hypothetical protein
VVLRRTCKIVASVNGVTLPLASTN